jgi:hypothetical protein
MAADGPLKASVAGITCATCAGGRPEMLLVGQAAEGEDDSRDILAGDEEGLEGSDAIFDAAEVEFSLPTD